MPSYFNALSLMLKSSCPLPHFAHERITRLLIIPPAYLMSVVRSCIGFLLTLATDPVYPPPPGAFPSPDLTLFYGQK